MIRDLSTLQNNYIRLLDAIICIPFLIIPLFVDLPYRVNIFLSWEGAYRLYLGQMPFQDFGLPMGFGYWLIPAAFFHLFGPSLFTLVKAQILINFISLISLRGILYRLRVNPLLISLSLLIFCLTYVIYNFWPWYNHSVVVFELAALYFVVRFVTDPNRKFALINVIIGAALAFLSFFTKQDAGAVCFVIGAIVLTYHGVIEKKYRALVAYVLTFFAIGLLTALPFLSHGFLYWFNYGQPPHNPRVGLIPLLDVFFSDAIWEKIYLVLFLFLIVAGGRRQFLYLFQDKNLSVLILITLGLIGQAIVTRVSSPLPTDHMTYFHAFGVTTLICLTSLRTEISKAPVFVFTGFVLILSFSQGYWKYVKGVLSLSVNKEDAAIPRRKDPWVQTHLEGFEKMLMPKETVEGMAGILQLKKAEKGHLKVLNMSELTPLALELGYTPPVDQPLWYHLNIGIFQREVDILCERVKKQEYDLVLFQDIPGLVHFFPYQVQDTLRKYYHLEDTFLAPRKLENSFIEVYVKK